MELIHQNNFSVAFYDKYLKAIFYQFAGEINVEHTLELFHYVMHFSDRNKVDAIIADLSQINDDFVMMNEFLEFEYFPFLIEKGLACCAFVVPDNVITQFATFQLSQNLGDFELQMFHQFGEARAWIENKVQNNTVLS